MTEKLKLTELSTEAYGDSNHPYQIFAVEIPENAFYAEMMDDDETMPIAVMVLVPDNLFPKGRPLPIYPLPALDYTVLFVTKTATEQQAASIVADPIGDKYYNYLWPKSTGKKSLAVDSAVESMQSLLKNLGLDALNYALLKVPKKSNL